MGPGVVVDYNESLRADSAGNVRRRCRDNVVMRRTASAARAAAWPALSGVATGGAGMSVAAALHVSSLTTAAMMVPWPAAVAAVAIRQAVRLRKASSKVDLASSDNVSMGT